MKYTVSVGKDFLVQRSHHFSMNVVKASKTFSSTILLYSLSFVHGSNVS